MNSLKLNGFTYPACEILYECSKKKLVDYGGVNMKNNEGMNKISDEVLMAAIEMIGKVLIALITKDANQD